MRRRTLTAIATLVVASTLATACGDSTDDAQLSDPNSESIASNDESAGDKVPANPPTGHRFAPGFPHLMVIGPASQGTVELPTFRWEPVDGAAAYQLVVIGPELPIWAWTGPATEVVLGGSLGETAVDVPAIVDGSCWSVVARDDSGVALAVSNLIPISPGSADHDCAPG